MRLQSFIPTCSFILKPSSLVPRLPPARPGNEARDFQEWFGLEIVHISSMVWMVVGSFPPSSEIQELDSNMQYLVYENHSKFIKASETIREVGEWGRGRHSVSLLCAFALFSFTSLFPLISLSLSFPPHSPSSLISPTYLFLFPLFR